MIKEFVKESLVKALGGQMVRYIVVAMDEYDYEEEGPEVEVRGLMFCQDVAEVGRAVREIQSKDWDWNLFEMVDGKSQRRAIVFEKDGRSVASIQ